MIQAIRELNLRPEYSVNLFEKKSLFTTQTTFNVTDGSGTYAPSENVQYNEFYSAFISSGTYNSNDFAFNFGDNYDVVAPQTGNYIFSWRFNNINFTSGFYVPFEYEIKVFRNGLLSETIFGQHIGNYQENAKKWNTYCQSFYAEAGETISFTFTIKADISYPYSVMNFFMGGLKLEYDDRYLGVPSMYSLPKDIYALNSQMQNFSFVSSLADLPNESSGIINLENDYTYFFTKSVDLEGNRLVCGQNTVILGTSSENVVLSSTGLVGVALITSNYSLPIRNITITADIALNLDGDGTTTALDWFGVNFTNCANVGTIKDYTNHVWTDCAFIESGNLTYDGTIGSIAINSSLFNTASSQTAFVIPSTCTITRRFRANLCAFIIGSGETGINLSTSASVQNESYILRECNFSGGGTYTTGVLYSDNKSRFRDNIGVPNSNEISQYYMNGNATPTVIASTGVPVKILGTTTSASITQRFDNTTSNKSTYLGSVTRVFEVVATISLISGNNNQIGAYIAKNGIALNESEMYVTTTGAGKAENVKIQTLVSLSTNDCIELFAENNTSVTNITITDLNLIIK